MQPARFKPKYLIYIVFILLSVPFVLCYWLFVPVLGREHSFQMFSQLLSLFPGIIGNYLRSAFYWCVLEQSALEVVISFGVVFSQTETQLEQGVYIGPQCNIGSCHLGYKVLLGSGVHILSGTSQHRFDDIETPIQDQGGEYHKVRIGEDTWVGNGAIVMADVGRKCVVGAGSVVTKPVPDYAIVVGNPARQVRSRNS